MPHADHKHQHTPAPNSAEAQGDGTWQPDLDPDYSEQLRHELKAARKQHRVVTPTDIWQPGEAVNRNPAESVQIGEYRGDVQSPPDIAQAAYPIGRGSPPIIRQGTPTWVWLLTAIGLIVAIMLFHQAGLYIFFIARLVILWLTKAMSAANRSDDLCSGASHTKV